MMRAAIHLGLTITLGMVAAACGGGEVRTQGTSRSSDWPRHLMTGEGSGPALYLSSEANAPAIGYVSPGVKVRVAGAAAGDRVPVILDGPLKVRGWLAVGRLAARVQRRGRVEGTPAYVGPNDIVGVRGAGATPGKLRIEVRPWLGRANAGPLGPFVGEIDAADLGADEVPPASVEAPSEGQPHLLPAGEEVAIYDRPGGEVVATFPALDPPLAVVVLRERGEWKGIRAGVGPYIVGYVDAVLTPSDAMTGEPGGVIGTAASGGGVPARLEAEADRPLWRVSERKRVRFDGRTIAIFREAGFAREMNRYPNGEVDVFVAVDDQVAIRGMLRADDLEEVEDGALVQPGSEGTDAPVSPAGATPDASPDAAPAPTAPPAPPTDPAAPPPATVAPPDAPPGGGATGSGGGVSPPSSSQQPGPPATGGVPRPTPGTRPGTAAPAPRPAPDASDGAPPASAPRAPSPPRSGGLVRPGE